MAHLFDKIWSLRMTLGVCLPLVMTSAWGAFEQPDVAFTYYWGKSEFYNFKIKELKAERRGSCLSVSGDAEYYLDGRYPSDRKLFVKVFIDWDGDGKHDEVIGKAVQLDQKGKNPHKVPISLCFSGIPSDAVREICVRTVIGAGCQPDDPNVLKGFPGAYKDAACEGFYEAPETWRPNVGTYADDDFHSVDGDGRLRPNNSVVAGTKYRVYPVFKMTRSMYELICATPSEFVIVIDGIPQYYGPKLKQMEGYSTSVSNGETYGLFTTESPIELESRFSSNAKDYGRKTLKVGYWFLSDLGCGKRREEKSWNYFLLFPRDKEIGNEPAWFNLWKQMCPAAKSIKYDKELKRASDWKASWVPDDFGVDLSDFDVDDSIDLPVIWKTACLMGPNVLNPDDGIWFNAGGVKLDEPIMDEYTRFREVSQIEKEKDDVLTFLTTAHVFMEGWKLGDFRFPRGPYARLVGDSDGDYVHESLEKPEELGTRNNDKDTFGVCDKYKLPTPGDLQYAARFLAVRKNKFDSNAYLQDNWAYPSVRTQHLPFSAKNVHYALNAAEGGKTSRAIDADEYEVYDLKAESEFDGRLGVVFAGARETTSDFENQGLTFSVDVIVSRAGEYETTGCLTDDSGNPVACATSRDTLPVGSSTVTLSFDPDVVARFAVQGKRPWRLSVVGFDGTDEEGNRCWQATRVVDCQTDEYLGRTCRTSTVLISGACTSSSGSNGLAVAIPLLFPEDGTYAVSAFLSDVAGEQTLSVASVSNAYGKGSSTVLLQFPLDDLAAAKKNGTFHLGQVNVRRLENDEVVHEDVLLPDYETVAYDAAEKWAASGKRLLDLKPEYMSVSFDGKEVPNYGYDSAALSLAFTSSGRLQGKTVRFEATLADTNGFQVAVATASHACDDMDDYSEEWCNHETVSFLAKDIAAAHCDGPYAIVRIVAYDATTGEKLDECRPRDLRTEPVALSELGAEGPVPCDLDGLSVQFVRAGSDGRIAELVLDVQVENALNADVEGTAILTNGDGYVIGQSACEYVPGEDGRGTLRLSFDGADVRASGRDGPYAVSGIEIWSRSLPDARVVVEQAYATGDLLASDFTSAFMSQVSLERGEEFDGSAEDYVGALLSNDGHFTGSVRLSCGEADETGACPVKMSIDKSDGTRVEFVGTTKNGRVKMTSADMAGTLDVVIGGNGFSGETGQWFVFGSNAAAADYSPVVGSWTVISSDLSCQLKVEGDGDVVSRGTGGGFALRGLTKAFCGEDRTYVPLNLASADGDCRVSALLQIDASGHVSIVGNGNIRTVMSSVPLYIQEAGRTERPRILSGPVDLDGRVGVPVEEAEAVLNALSYPCTFRAEGLPRGLTVDSQTGLVSGTPEEPCEGLVTIVVTSQDDVSWETRTTFSIKVLDLPADIVGSYTGILDALGGSSSTVVIYPTGRITGTICLASGRQTSFAAQSFWYCNVYEDGCSASFDAEVDDGNMTIGLSFYHGEGQLTCSGEFGANGEWMEVEFAKNSLPLPTVSVAYDAHGGTCSQTVSADVVKGTPVGILPDAERAGYGFQGWYTQATGGALVGPEELMLSNTVLHAHWLPNTYVVHFDANGGTGEMDNQIMTYDADAHLPLCEFSRRGHVFAGWNIGEPAQDDGDAPDLTADGAEVKNLTAEANGLVTLYAAWDEIEDAPPVYIRDGILVRYDDPIERGVPPAIPPEVRTIGDGCFALASNLTCVMIPESVTNIGPYAFFGCSNLETVVFHEGLVSIDSGAFAQCVSLGEIALPSSVRRVGDALAPTNAVAAVVRSADGESLVSTNFEETVEGQRAVRSLERSEKVHAWSLLNRGLGAFDGCSSLTSAILNEGLERLGAATFRECVSLVELEVPQSVANIGGQAVLCLQSLSQQQSREVDSLQIEGLPASVLSLERDERNETMAILRTDAGFLEGCVSLERVSLPQGLESLGARAFADCGLLREVDLPDSLRALDRGTFCCCTGLERVGLPANLEVIGRGEMPFEWKRTYDSDMVRQNDGRASVLTEERVESVIDGVATSMESANGGRWSVVTAEDHDMRYRPEDGVFYGCAALRELELPDSVQTLCDYSFADCGDLQLTFDGPPPTCGTNAVADCQVGFYLPELADQWSPVIVEGHWNGLEMREMSGEPPPAADRSQGMALATAGWHEVSFAVLPESGDPADVFAPVADKIGFVTYGSRNWNPLTGGTLLALEIGRGYWVQTTAANVSWTVTGLANPDVEISLKPGWNLIGYPLLGEGEVETVLATALATGKIDWIYSGSRVYPDTLTTMTPGKGYWVYANEAVTIRFDF